MGTETELKKGNSLLALPDTYTVVDLETTGLDPCWDSIIEIGAMRVENDRVTKTFTTLVNPNRRVTPFISRLTGITNEMLITAPNIEQALPRFLAFVGNSIVVGHNVNFDIGFLCEACRVVIQKPFLNDFVDTMRLSRKLFPWERHHKLCDLVTRFGIGESVQHRALADVEQTNRCYQYLKRYIAENSISVIR